MKAIWASIVFTVVFAATAVNGDERQEFRARLSSFQAVPTLSTTGRGEFRAMVQGSGADMHIMYRLSFSDLEGGPAMVAHIHLGARATNGGVIAFLCGGGGKPACGGTAGTVEGTIVAADIIGPAAQGITAGEFAEALRAMRAGVTYANIHNATYPAGEIRGQIRGAQDDR